MEMPQIDSNNENEIVQTENTQEVIKATDLLKLLKKLTELQAQSAVVKAGKAVKNVEKGLEAKATEFKSYMEAEEKKYRPKSYEPRKIEKEYLTLLDQVNDILKQDIEIPIALKNKYESLEAIEIEKIAKYQMAKGRYQEIKKEIKSIENSEQYKKYDEMISTAQNVLQTAVKNGDTKTIEEYNNELKYLQQKQSEMLKEKKEQAEAKKAEISNLKGKVKPAKENLEKIIRPRIKEQEEYIKKAKDSAANAVLIGLDSRNKQLVSLKRRNAIFKFFDSVRSAIGGEKKFSENVIEPLKREIETIKREKIPELQAGVYARLAEQELKLKQFEEKAKQTATKGKETVVNTKNKVIKGVKTVGKTSVEVAKKVGKTGAEIGMTAGGIVVGGIYLAGKGTKNTILNVVNAGKEKKESFLRKMANKLQNKIDSYENKKQERTDIDRDEK